MNGWGADMLPLWFAHIGCRLCFVQQKMIKVIDGLGADAAKFFVAPIGMDIIFEQADISVIGWCHPFFLTVFFDELIQELAYGNIIVIHMGVLFFLIFNRCFAGFGCRIAQPRFPYLMTIWTLALIINDRICFASLYDWSHIKYLRYLWYYQATHRKRVLKFLWFCRYGRFWTLPNCTVHMLFYARYSVWSVSHRQSMSVFRQSISVQSVPTT